MLQFTHHADRPTLRLLVLHDDPDREYAYTASADASLAKAKELDWTVVSMKDDWNTVYGSAHD